MVTPIVELIARVIAHSPDDRAIAHAASHAALLIEAEGVEGLMQCESDAISSLLRAQGYRRAEASGTALAAAFALARQASVDAARCRTPITTSADVAAWATPQLASLAHEELWLLALDGRSHLRSARCIARGGLHGVSTRAGDVLRAALRSDASAFVLVHNHPSGDPSPSHEDIVFTRAVGAAARVVGIAMVDHVVVAASGFAAVPFGSEGG